MIKRVYYANGFLFVFLFIDFDTVLGVPIGTTDRAFNSSYNFQSFILKKKFENYKPPQHNKL